MAGTGNRPQRSTLNVALRGAAAGIAGGLAVTIVEREVLARLAGGTVHQAQWDDRAARALRRGGVPVRGRGRIAAGVGSQLLYAGALGATYALLHQRTKDSRAGRTLLDGAMTYAASLVFPDVPQPKRRPGQRALRRKLVKPANPAATFSRTTAIALGFLVK